MILGGFFHVFSLCQVVLDHCRSFWIVVDCYRIFHTIISEHLSLLLLSALSDVKYLRQTNFSIIQKTFYIWMYSMTLFHDFSKWLVAA